MRIRRQRNHLCGPMGVRRDGSHRARPNCWAQQRCGRGGWHLPRRTSTWSFYQHISACPNPTRFCSDRRSSHGPRPHHLELWFHSGATAVPSLYCLPSRGLSFATGPVASGCDTVACCSQYLIYLQRGSTLIVENLYLKDAPYASEEYLNNTNNVPYGVYTANGLGPWPSVQTEPNTTVRHVPRLFLGLPMRPEHMRAHGCAY